eukprot:TRINITY_DN43769_c0_g1_i1.p1 TRINITY_DN43769_c0_g1~~TRINITY_DN43769_c0_g1_i1.p1  ORF type:complete len:128 (+),score=31.25 TRINITY_DN43769_c0_g1_i1:108-491(+)
MLLDDALLSMYLRAASLSSVREAHRNDTAICTSSWVTSSETVNLDGLVGSGRRLGLSPDFLFSATSARLATPNGCSIGRLLQASTDDRWAGSLTSILPVSYTHLRAHETPEHLVCRLLLEKKKKKRI